MISKKELLKSQRNKEELELFLKSYGAELITYEYYSKIFGNYIVVIKVEGQLHTFITDRGEINHNSKMVCDNSYHVAGCDDTFSKLLEVIQNELF